MILGFSYFQKIYPDAGKLVRYENIIVVRRYIKALHINLFSPDNFKPAGI